MTKDELANINMELIAYVGSAKSSFLMAIDEALAGNIEQAEATFEMGREDFTIGHQTHGKLLTAFANGVEMEMDLLTIHAQCQLMSAEDFMTIAQKVIAKCKEIK